MQKGIIVSIQGYHYKTIAELAIEAVNAGAIALRIDKKIDIDHAMMQNDKVETIGLRKIAVDNIKDTPFITPDVETLDKVYPWCDYVAIDYRRCNKNLPHISEYCKEKKIKVVADIENFEDYQEIKAKDLYYTYVATTLSVFNILFRPDLKLLAQIASTGEKNLIAEGNFVARPDVKEAFEIGARAVCIGGAIANVYKLTRKYTSIEI